MLQHGSTYAVSPEDQQQHDRKKADNKARADRFRPPSDSARTSGSGSGASGGNSRDGGDRKREYSAYAASIAAASSAAAAEAAAVGAAAAEADAEAPVTMDDSEVSPTSSPLTPQSMMAMSSCVVRARRARPIF